MPPRSRLIAATTLAAGLVLIAGAIASYLARPALRDWLSEMPFINTVLLIPSAVLLTGGVALTVHGWNGVRSRTEGVPTPPVEVQPRPGAGRE